MFEKVISPTTRESLASLSKLPVFQQAYLAGGTALALQLGHRYSYDLDFFTPEEFDERIVLEQIAETLPDFTLERQDWRTILGVVGDIRLSLFFYQYKLLFPAQEFSGIKLASLKDIAAMKVAAIADRGAKRDFIDLYFLLKEGHVSSLKEALENYDRKFGRLAANKLYILKSLGYFEEADKEASPQMIKKVSWEEVRRLVQQEQEKVAKQLL